MAEAGVTGKVLVPGTYADITVGSLIHGRNGHQNDAWEVVEMRNPVQHELGKGPWLRVINVTTGEESRIPPRHLTSPVTFLVDEHLIETEEPKMSPELLPPRQELSDQAAVDLLVRELGATEIARKDHATGIITCPAYEERMLPMAEYRRHLEIAHGIDMTNVPDDPATVVTLHGKSHNPSEPYVGKGGFPHQHEASAELLSLISS
jgi:hypothetical protein